jgi:hypothetical protein
MLPCGKANCTCQLLAPTTPHKTRLLPCNHPQVKHFDELQEAKARAVKNLHNTINSKATQSAGNLAGASQQ